MSVRRIADEQPASFAFTPQNLAWAEKKITEYPKGRHASAVIPLLWKAQEQHNGWLPEPAMRLVADMLEMPYIRVFEIATFYTMFQLKPVGSVAHVGVCGTTPCMLRGAEELKDVCRTRIAPRPFELSADGRFSWEEVECAGACVNAPMVQVGADTYEDLTPETLLSLIDRMDRGEPVEPGPQSGRKASEPITGATTLTSPRKDVHPRKPDAPGDAAPDTDVDPRSPAAAGQKAAKPDTRDRADVEATRTSDAPARPASPVAPEPKTNGQISYGPDEPEKQKAARGPGDPNSGGSTVPVGASGGPEVETTTATVDETTAAQADRAAPGADLAQEPLVEGAEREPDQRESAPEHGESLPKKPS